MFWIDSSQTCLIPTTHDLSHAPLGFHYFVFLESIFYLIK